MLMGIASFYFKQMVTCVVGFRPMAVKLYWGRWCLGCICEILFCNCFDYEGTCCEW